MNKVGHEMIREVSTPDLFIKGVIDMMVNDKPCLIADRWAVEADGEGVVSGGLGRDQLTLVVSTRRVTPVVTR